jgi:hypothetical protein
MRKHHTKNKGDLGILYAQLDLARKGYGVLTPLTEHEAFDLVAYKDGRFYRVQVKYRAAVRGAIRLRFASSWADRRGNHVVPVDKAAVEIFCVYCPNTDECYYVDPRIADGTVSLRILPPTNFQKRGIHWAHDFRDMPAAVRGVPAGSHGGLEEPADVRQSDHPDGDAVARP